METACLLKNRNGFLALDALLALMAVSVMVSTCAVSVINEVNFKRSIEEKWDKIKDRENEILSSIEAGCALGCLREMDLP